MGDAQSCNRYDEDSAVCWNSLSNLNSPGNNHLRNELRKSFQNVSEYYHLPPCKLFFLAFSLRQSRLYLYSTRVWGQHLRIEHNIMRYTNAYKILRWFKKLQKQKIEKILLNFYYKDLTRIIVSYI